MVTTFQQTRDTMDATPALIIDLPTVERNLRRLGDYSRQHGIAVRPHTKTHKSRRMSRLQLEAGAAGLTVAKVGEAEVMAQESSDILVAYPAIDPWRSRRLAALAREVTVRVAVDSLEGIDALAAAAHQLSSTIGILVDIDVGNHRTGVQTPEQSLALAQQVARHAPALRLDGIFFYPGHVWALPDQQSEPLRQVDALLTRAIDLWKHAGLAAPIVSGGSTPTAFQSHLVSCQTETRPGTYIYNDMNTVLGGFCALEDCAAAFICTVVSTAVPGKAVVDAGSKTLTSDRNVRFPDSGHGRVLEYPSAKIVRLSEEHGEIDFSDGPHRPRVGERVTIVPNHICPCINLQDWVWLQLAGGDVETLEIDTRGKLS